jgi:hypothetical protein
VNDGRPRKGVRGDAANGGRSVASLGDFRARRQPLPYNDVHTCRRCAGPIIRTRMDGMLRCGLCLGRHLRLVRGGAV